MTNTDWRQYGTPGDLANHVTQMAQAMRDSAEGLWHVSLAEKVEAAADCLRDLWESRNARTLDAAELAVDQQSTAPQAHGLPTIHRHVDGGYVWSLCPECGPDVSVDEDGLCGMCGAEAVHYGCEPKDASQAVEDGWQQYRRTNIAEMRPYVPGEGLSGISVSEQDDPESDLGMIARNPQNHADQWYVARKYFEENFAALSAAPQAQHPDDAAVDRFAAAMKAKLAQKRDEGRGGWDDKDDCPPGRLQQMLLDHLPKGDPVDIGNFAMMLWNRGEGVEAPQAQQSVEVSEEMVEAALAACVRHSQVQSRKFWEAGTYDFESASHEAMRVALEAALSAAPQAQCGWRRTDMWGCEGDCGARMLSAPKYCPGCGKPVAIQEPTDDSV